MTVTAIVACKSAMNMKGARQVPNRSVISSPTGMPTIWASAWKPETVPNALPRRSCGMLSTSVAIASELDGPAKMPLRMRAAISNS